MVGIGLILLGGCSGIAQFVRAIQAEEKDPAGQGTLWGLFLLGIFVGLGLTVSAVQGL